MQTSGVIGQLTSKAAPTGRIVTISINDSCPLKCKHCSVGYRDGFSGSGNKMTEEGLRESILSIDTQYYDLVSFVGGEPSLAPDLLRVGIEACHEVGLGPVITTAPVWAKTPETATKFLRKLPTSFFINLSYDNYHLEHLSIDHYLNAIRATRELGSYVIMVICFTEESEKAELLGRLSSVIHMVHNANWQQVVPVGNAGQPDSSLNQQSIDIESADDLNRLNRTCHVGDSFVTRDFKLHACCYSSTYDDSPLHFQEGDMRTSFLTMEKDETFQALRKGGFINSLSDIARQAIADRLKGESFTNECDLCIHLMDRKHRSFWDEFIAQGAETRKTETQKTEI